MSNGHERLLENALARIEALEAELAAAAREREPVAIIGMACRFPGANDSEEYWNLLVGGHDAIAVVPFDRWDADAYYDPDPEAPGKISTRFGGFVGGLAEFDASFFGISAREAASVDPQQRLLLETAWEAFERAGLPPRDLPRSTGVFIGVSNIDYREALVQQGSGVDGYFSSGSTPSTASGRLSYFFGLSGPSLSVDTACSSSAVAIHLALASLRRGECDLAIAGGVNRIITPHESISLSKARMLSPDGRCKAFDASADGYGRSEGCGLVVLARLSDARGARSRIDALIRGSAVNQDGHRSGLTVPHGPSQQAVIRLALRDADLEPKDVGYVEAHGTGTALGDPIEAGALGAVFGGRDESLRIGSAKSNIGHLEAAAGVAGVIKVALALRAGTIPPHLHFRRPSPLIDWNALPISIPAACQPWPREHPAAGVSSFGFSGTNCHLVLEPAPADVRSAPEASRPLHLLTLSARTSQALRELAERYRVHLRRDRDDVADVCFTANAGRSHFEHRLCVIGATSSELADALQRGLTIRGHRPPHGNALRIGFVFAGEDSFDAGAGRSLYDAQPSFRRALEACSDIIRTGSPRDPRLACFALEYALVEMWRQWGITPDRAVGRGVGALAAAWCMGTLPLETAISRAAEEVTDQGDVEVLPPEDVDFCLEIGPSATYEATLTALAHLHAQGATVDWQAFDAGFARRKVALPTYPFERERHWFAAAHDESGAWRTWLVDVKWKEWQPAGAENRRKSWRVIEDDRPIDVTGCTDVVFLAERGLAGDVPRRAEALTIGLLDLAQRLARAASRPRLWIVTRNAQAVVDGDVVAVEQSAVWGLARTIAAEHPELDCTCVDLDAPADPAALPRLLDPLRGTARIALRRGRWYSERLVPRAHVEPERVLASDASWIITGGLGGLGLQVARRLAAEGVRRLILVSRRAPAGEARTAIAEIERHGAAVHAVQADVANEDDVARLVANARALAPLRGVVHAAGCVDDDILELQTAERFRAVLAPKVTGAWNLHVHTRHLPLDAFVAFSSVAALVPTLRSGAYAAANAFLDGLMHARAAAGLRALSINWGPWAEVGLAAREAPSLAVVGMRAIPPSAGARAAVSLARSAAGQICVAPGDWLQRRVAAPPPRATFALPDRPYGLAAQLEELLADILGAREPLDLQRGFADLGMDSLMAMELRERLQQSLGRELPSTLAFKYPRFDDLLLFLQDTVGSGDGDPVRRPAAETEPTIGALVDRISEKYRAHRE